MIEPYQAIGLVPTMRGIRHRDEIGTNLEHLSQHSVLSTLGFPRTTNVSLEFRNLGLYGS